MVGLVARTPKMKAYIALILTYASVNAIIAIYYVYQIYNNPSFSSPYLFFAILSNIGIILALLLPFYWERKKVKPVG